MFDWSAMRGIESGVGDTCLELLGAHSLTGVDYKRAKADQFRALTRHVVGLHRSSGEAVFVLDAYEPVVDAWEHADSESVANYDKGCGADAPGRRRAAQQSPSSI